MEFHRRSPHRPASLGILAGSFNPPTLAHLELARAARSRVDEVLFVVPRVFPHKAYTGATLEQRLEMLDSCGLDPSHSIAVADGGLFIDIARECREHYGENTNLCFVCGRDAAERILQWNYPESDAVSKMMREFELLVAERSGSFSPPPELRHRIHPLLLEGRHDHVSSTDARERIARREAWEHLVPESIVDRVRAIYS